MYKTIKIVYRIQDKDRRGPYRDEYIDRWDNKNHNRDLILYPTPQTDQGICTEMTEDIYCAFSSMKQLRGWFSNKQLKELRELGLKIYVLKAEIIDKSSKQILIKFLK